MLAGGGGQPAATDPYASYTGGQKSSIQYAPGSGGATSAGSGVLRGASPTGGTGGAWSGRYTSQPAAGSYSQISPAATTGQGGEGISQASVCFGLIYM